jgi:anti-sigma regulatory factor (Ser/Thr protein kinase)
MQMQTRQPATLPIDVWLAANAASVPKARGLVREAVEGWFPDEATHRLEIVVTELVANAAEHAGGTGIHLLVKDAPHGALLVECWDGSDAEPDVESGTPGADGDDGIDIAGLAEDGRGLFLSSAVSNDFHCRTEPTGKTMVSVIDPASPR